MPDALPLYLEIERMHIGASSWTITYERRRSSRCVRHAVRYVRNRRGKCWKCICRVPRLIQAIQAPKTWRDDYAHSDRNGVNCGGSIHVSEPAGALNLVYSWVNNIRSSCTNTLRFVTCS